MIQVEINIILVLSDYILVSLVFACGRNKHLEWGFGEREWKRARNLFWQWPLSAYVGHVVLCQLKLIVNTNLIWKATAEQLKTFCFWCACTRLSHNITCRIWDSLHAFLCTLGQKVDEDVLRDFLHLDCMPCYVHLCMLPPPASHGICADKHTQG